MSTYVITDFLQEALAADEIQRLLVINYRLTCNMKYSEFVVHGNGETDVPFLGFMIPSLRQTTCP